MLRNYFIKMHTYGKLECIIQKSNLFHLSKLPFFRKHSCIFSRHNIPMARVWSTAHSVLNFSLFSDKTGCNVFSILEFPLFCIKFLKMYKPNLNEDFKYFLGKPLYMICLFFPNSMVFKRNCLNFSTLIFTNTYI